MRENYSFNKRKREEAHKKKQEEKRNRRLNKSKNAETAVPGTEASPVETPAAES